MKTILRTWDGGNLYHQIREDWLALDTNSGVLKRTEECRKQSGTGLRRQCTHVRHIQNWMAEICDKHISVYQLPQTKRQHYGHLYSRGRPQA